MSEPEKKKKFHGLPPEILAVIVRMARDQDARLQDRLTRSREKVVMATKEVMKTSEWYGKSLLALHATCKTFEELAKPLVYESVKFSKSSQDYFLDHVLLNYAHLIKQAVFDPRPSYGYSAAFHAYVITMAGMPSLKSLKFKTRESLTEYQALYTCAHEATTSATATSRALRPLFAQLSKRVTHLTCLEAVSSQMKFFIGQFPNLTSLKRRICAKQDLTEESGEACAYSALKSLKELDLSTLTHADEVALTRLSGPIARFHWDQKWNSLSWSSVSLLSFSTSIFMVNDWLLLSTFRDSLKYLSITTCGVHPGWRPLEEANDPIPFPHLSSLEIVGDTPTVECLLRLFRLAPLVEINLKIVNHRCEHVHNLIFKSDGEWSGFTEPFATSLRILRLQARTIPYTSQETAKTKDCCISKSVWLESTELAESALFGERCHSFSSIDWETHPGRDNRAYDLSVIVEEASEVLEQAYNLLRKSGRFGDGKEVHRLVTLIRPLAAKRLMDLE